MDWNALSAVFSVVTGLATVAVAVVAWIQLGAIARNQREWETLKACEKYDTDPILDRALRVLRDARNSGALFTVSISSLSLEYSTVLNYFEGLATGIDQGFYVEMIVRDHLQEIMQFHVDEALVKLKLPRNPGDFKKIEQLLEIWDRNEPYFRKRRIWS